MKNDKYPTTLPKKLAYGASVFLDEGVLCTGGNNVEITSTNVFLLRFNSVDDEVEQEEYLLGTIGIYDCCS